MDNEWGKGKNNKSNLTIEAKTEEVIMYKCSDGQLFDNAEKAIRHERKIEARKFVHEIVERECFRDMTKDDITDFLMENMVELSLVFNQVILD